MTARRKWLLVLAGGVLLLAAAITGTVVYIRATATPYPMGLFAVSSARDVRLEEEGNGIWIHYTIDEAYPAKESLTELQDALAKQGWVPDGEKRFNMEGKPAVPMQWGESTSPAQPGEPYRFWHGMWKHGDWGRVIYFVTLDPTETAPGEEPRIKVDGGLKEYPQPSIFDRIMIRIRTARAGVKVPKSSP